MNLPRGIRAFETRGKPVCQWLVDGKRKTRAFATKGDRDRFAASVAGDLKENGVAAFRINPDELRELRALRARVGPDVLLEDLCVCWERHGAKRPSLTVATAVERFLEAKEAEGISKLTMEHYRPLFAAFCERFGKRGVASMGRDDITSYLENVSESNETKRTVFGRIRSLFNWLVAADRLDRSPCFGVRGPKIVAQPVEILTVEQTAELFAAAGEETKELYGRLALEAFAGLRFTSAAAVLPEHIDFTAKGLTLPAALIKTRRREYIDSLPDNVWAWLEWADVPNWRMTYRQYLEAKSKAFVNDDGSERIPHPRNCLRHSFATYHVAENRNAAATAVILCHKSPTMLYKHYRGAAKHADGVAYFKILPSRAVSS